MNFDISHILDDWPYENGQLSARRINGADGRDKLQLRQDLGVLQMETTGRPDGKKPYGFECLLDYYRNQLQLYREGDQEEQFSLDKQACEALRAEAAMYYHRYLAGFILEDFEIVQRDTQRNLDLIDFCGEYAAEESDKHLLEHYRPYVVMMNTRARARLALADNQPKVALAAVREAIVRIRRHYERYGTDEINDAGGELAMLNELADEIEQRVPVDPLTKLRKQLDLAVTEERYEDAATLRDQLSRVTDDPKHPHPGRPDEGRA